MEITTRDVEATRRFGARLGRLLQPGDFVALHGDLGAGKTQFVQGVASGLAVPAEYRVTSPTYTLLNIFPGRVPLYHFDLYRLATATEALDLGFEEYFYGAGACLVEWAERLGREHPADFLAITFFYASDTQRLLRCEPHGARADELVRLLAAGENSFDS